MVTSVGSCRFPNDELGRPSTPAPLLLALQTNDQDGSSTATPSHPQQVRSCSRCAAPSLRSRQLSVFRPARSTLSRIPHPSPIHLRCSNGLHRAAARADAGVRIEMAKVLGGPRSCDGHETDGDHGLGCATAQDAHRIRSGSPNSPSSAFDDQRPRDSNGRKDGIEPQLRLAPSLSPQAAAPASKAQQRFTPGPVHGEVNALNSQPPGTPAAVTPRLPPDMLLAEASRPQRRPPPATIHPSHPTPDIHPFPYTPAAPPERLGSRAADVAQHAPAHIVSRFGQLLKL
ncbi:hypothetical protein V8E36_004252 [Tilletia maclaganii]